VTAPRRPAVHNPTMFCDGGPTCPGALRSSLPPRDAAVPMAAAGDAWREGAACKDTPDALWFPDCQSGSTESRRAVEFARAICAGCEVREACLRVGMGERDGIWGGLLPTERERLRKGTA
jgi:WhiB family redox-sensing transcriptional regulator